MDNEFLDDIETDAGTDQSGSALRKFGKEQKKRADELAAELAQVKATLAKQATAEVFTKLGVSDKVRKFYSGEPTEEAIKEWWAENAEIFGVEPKAEEAVLTDEQRQAQADLSNIERLGSLGQERPSAVSTEAISQVRTDLLSNRNHTEADFDAALRKLNIPDRPVIAPQW